MTKLGGSGRMSSIPLLRGPFTVAVMLVPDNSVVCDVPKDLTSEPVLLGFVPVLEIPVKALSCG